MTQPLLNRQTAAQHMTQVKKHPMLRTQGHSAPVNDSSTAPNICRTWPERSPSASSMNVRAARDSCTSLSSAIAVSSCSANPTDCTQTLW